MNSRPAQIKFPHPRDDLSSAIEDLRVPFSASTIAA